MSTMDVAINELTTSMMEANLNPTASLTPILETAGEDPAPTSFESVASAILELVADIRRMHDNAYARSQESKTQRPIPDQPTSSQSGKRARIGRHLWPFKRSSNASTSGPPSLADTQQVEHEDPHSDSWDGLLSYTAEATNRVVAAHVIVETEEYFKNKSPPLFWLLYNGHG